MSDEFTIDETENDKGRYPVEFHGKKITGNALLRVRVDKEDNGGLVPAFVLELSPVLVENGRTVYRSADPELDEIQKMDAVIRNPVRVNGVGYEGDIWAKWSTRAWKYTTNMVSAHRIGTYASHTITDSAREIFNKVIDDIAAEFVTSARIESAEYRHMQSERSWVLRKLEKMQRETDDAQAELEYIDKRIAELET